MSIKLRLTSIICIFVLLLPILSASQEIHVLISSEVGSQLIAEVPIIHSRQVRATAYNADPSQTDDTPNICAWGDKIHEGVVAISRDLEKLGLTRNKIIYVAGFGRKIVKDRMHYRKKNQIDIYMEKYEDAMEFGVRFVNIFWIEGIIKIYEKFVINTYIYKGATFTNKKCIGYRIEPSSGEILEILK